MLNTSLTPVSTSGSKTALPPGPKGRPILGLLPEFRRDPAGFLLRTAREYGDIVFVRLGPQKLYLLNRPEHIQDVLVTNQREGMVTLEQSLSGLVRAGVVRHEDAVPRSLYPMEIEGLVPMPRGVA